MPNIAVLYTAVAAPEAAQPEGDADQAVPPSPILASRADNARVANITAAALTRAGHHVKVLGVWDRLPLKELAGVDAVLNLLEGLCNDSSREGEATRALEATGIPFSGNTGDVLAHCQDKERCRALLQRAGVPVPVGMVLRQVPSQWPAGLPSPCMVKPVCEDASEGIDQAAVARDLPGLQHAVERLLTGMGQAALCEAFIEGREVTASLLGSPPQVLPLGEIDFSRVAPGQAHIVCYAAKWMPESPEYLSTPSVGCTLDASIQERVRRIAVDAALALGLRDIARLDLRVDAAGNPFVIDVNPNCDLAPDAGFAKAGARAGLDHEALLQRVMARALGSRPAASTVHHVPASTTASP